MRNSVPKGSNTRMNTKMPVRTVYTTRNGKPIKGYRWGDSGKIYTGPGAEKRAAAQGRAAYASGYQPRRK